MIKYKDLKPFYISNLLSQNLDNIINVCMEKNMSAVFIIDGRSGLGKTTLSTQVSCYIAKKVAEWKQQKEGGDGVPKFDIEDLCFTPPQFIDRVKQAKKGDIVIMDESMILSNRSAMSLYNKAVVVLMSQIRSKQMFIIFNINSIFDLDRNLAIFRSDLLLHVYAEDDKFGDRGRYMVIPSAKGKLKNLYIQGKKYYSYNKARPAFLDTFSGWFPFSQKEYDDRKNEAVEKFIMGEQKLTPRQIKQQHQRDVLLYHMHYKLNVKQSELAELIGVEQPHVSLAINNLSKNGFISFVNDK